MDAVKDGRIGVEETASLNNEAARSASYSGLALNGSVAKMIDKDERQRAVDGAVFYAVYDNT